MPASFLPGRCVGEKPLIVSLLKLVLFNLICADFELDVDVRKQRKWPQNKNAQVKSAEPIKH